MVYGLSVCVSVYPVSPQLAVGSQFASLESFKSVARSLPVKCYYYISNIIACAASSRGTRPPARYTCPYPATYVHTYTHTYHTYHTYILHIHTILHTYYTIPHTFDFVFYSSTSSITTTTPVTSLPQPIPSPATSTTRSSPPLSSPPHPHPLSRVAPTDRQHSSFPPSIPTRRDPSKSSRQTPNTRILTKTSFVLSFRS